MAYQPLGSCDEGRELHAVDRVVCSKPEDGGTTQVLGSYEDAIDKMPVIPMHYVLLAVFILKWAALGCVVECVPYLFPVLKAEWQLNEVQLAMTSTGIMGGSLVGCFLVGVVADQRGRRPVLVACSCLTFALAVAQAAAPGFSTFVLCRVCLGFSFGGEIVLAPNLLSESVPQAVRGKFVSLIGLGWPLGALLANAIVATFDSNWRTALMGSSLPCGLWLLCLFVVHESPRFLLAARMYDAVDVLLAQTYRQGGVSLDLPCLERVPRTTSADDEGTQSLRLFRCPLLSLTMCVLALWVCIAGASYGVKMWIGMYIKTKFALPTLPYVAVGVMTVADALGGLLSAMLIDTLGRHTCLGLAFAVCAGCTLTLPLAASVGVLTGLASVQQMLQSVIWQVLTVFTNETFPIDVRASAAGLGNSSARMAAIAVPIFGGSLMRDVSVDAGMLLFGCIYCAGGASVCCLHAAHDRSMADHEPGGGDAAQAAVELDSLSELQETCEL